MLTGVETRMRCWAGTVLLACVVSGCASQAGLPAVAQVCPALVTAGEDVEEIRRLEMRGAQVNVEGWAIEEASEFFAPEWQSIQPDGGATGRAAVLDAFRDGRSVPWAGRFELTDLDIRVYCDMAVVFGRAEAYRMGAPAEAAPAARFRFTNIWRKTNSGWVYAANQFTRY